MPEAKRILVVEDEETTMRSLLIALNYGGFEVVCAHTGAEAIELLEKSAGSGEAIDFIVYDINLPDMTGLDLMAALDRQGGAALPSLAITGFASHETTSTLRETGREILEKPFQRDELYERIRTITAAHDGE